MKIGIDLSTFRTHQGTEVYAEHVVQELLQDNSPHEFFIFTNKCVFPSIERRVAHLKHAHIILNDPKTTLTLPIQIAFYQQCILPLRMWKRGIEVVFSPSPFFPLLAPGKKVVTIHDCAYKHFKEFRNSLSELYIRISILSAKYLAASVITVSNFSKKELKDVYGFSEEKLHVLYEGVPTLPPSQQLVSYGKYFFFIGSPRPRKNLKRLLSAFKAFHTTHPEYKLVLGGRRDTRFLDVTEYAQHLGLEHSVIETDFISNEEKTALYKNATALVFPSLYEGFGLPVLEAQSVGTPVLTSQISALPEIAGAGALYIDPHSTTDIIRAMNIITKDQNIRQKLITEGFTNAKRFSWEKTARQLLAILEQ